MLVLASPELATDHFKTLLSEINEVLPCMLRQESELIDSQLFRNIITVKISSTEGGESH